MSMKRWMTFVLVLLAVSSCQPDDQRTDTLNPEEAFQKRENMPVGVVAQLDSGSAAFRADDFEGALRNYRNATELGPDVAAAWFGVYMAHDALGNTSEAADALARARGEVPGATLLHGPAVDTIP